jgi:hypothetical protein
MNNIMLLVGLVDKMCFKTLFVVCMGFNIFVASMNLKSYLCIVVCHGYVYLCGL